MRSRDPHGTLDLLCRTWCALPDREHFRRPPDVGPPWGVDRVEADLSTAPPTTSRATRRRVAGWPAAAIVAWLLGVAGLACAGNGASVNLGLTADKSAYAAGEALRFTVTVDNRGTQPVTLTFRTAQRFDVRIQDPAGREVWRWSADRMFAQVLGEERLEPGARRSWNVAVREPLPAGTYTVVASLESVNLEVSSSIGITVR